MLIIDPFFNIDPLFNRLIPLHGSIKLHLVSELLLIIIIILLTHLSYFKIGACLFVCLFLKSSILLAEGVVFFRWSVSLSGLCSGILYTTQYL